MAAPKMAAKMGLKGGAKEEERPPIDFDKIDGEKVVERPMFKLGFASDAVIRNMEAKRADKDLKIYDSATRLDAVVAKSGFVNFKVTAPKLPSIQDKYARRTSTSTLASTVASPAADASPTSSLQFGSTMGSSFSDFRKNPKFSRNLKSGLDDAGNRMKRADQYFQLLMRAKQKKDDSDRKAAEAEEWRRCEGAARVAFEKAIGVVKERDNNSEMTTDSEAEESQEEEDFGELTAYDGQMKIEIDFVIVKPHVDEDKEEDLYPPPGLTLDDLEGDDLPLPVGEGSEAGDSDEAPSTPPLDFSDDMAELTVELKKAGKLDEQPKGIAAREAAEVAARQGVADEKRMPNIWNNPFPEWSLETGGSMFFIPDAERYAWSPSLPPPPPPSMLGRRRIRLKPRLPLTLSNHRYKDEHPNIWPPDQFSPSQDHYKSFEQKLLTYDLYKGCVESLAKMPRQEFAKDDYRHRLKFGSFMESALRGSVAWRNWRRRESRKRKTEEQRKQKEREAEARRKLEKERKQKLAEEALRLAQDDDD